MVKQIEMDTLLDTLDTGHTDPLFHSQLGDLTRSRRTHNITIKITIKIPLWTYINKWPNLGLTLTNGQSGEGVPLYIYELFFQPASFI